VLTMMPSATLTTCRQQKGPVLELFTAAQDGGQYAKRWSRGADRLMCNGVEEAKRSMQALQQAG
jgi:hypothetical protein